MTPARQVIPGRTVFITSRCSNRQFRAVPTKSNVEAIWYCLGATMAKYPGVEVHAFLWMSNHLHLVATPRDATMPKFMQDLNSLTSRALNALRGTSGPNFEPHYNMVEVTDPEKLLEHCAYTLANPCTADLVTRADKWRGVTSWGMAFGEAKVIERPAKGLWRGKQVAPETPKRRKHRKFRNASRGRARYRGRWVTKARVEVALTRPPGFEGLANAELEAKLRELVYTAEDKAEAKRAKEGRRVLGMRRVRAQAWHASPRQPEDMFGPVPSLSGKSRWKRMEAEQRSRVFQSDHRAAVEAFRRGVRDVVFPFGTWLMRERFNVCCAPAPP